MQSRNRWPFTGSVLGSHTPTMPPVLTIHLLIKLCYLGPYRPPLFSDKQSRIALTGILITLHSLLSPPYCVPPDRQPVLCTLHLKSRGGTWKEWQAEKKEENAPFLFLVANHWDVNRYRSLNIMCLAYTTHNQSQFWKKDVTVFLLTVSHRVLPSWDLTSGHFMKNLLSRFMFSTVSPRATEKCMRWISEWNIFIKSS